VTLTINLLQKIEHFIYKLLLIIAGLKMRTWREIDLL